MKTYLAIVVLVSCSMSRLVESEDIEKCSAVGILCMSEDVQFCSEVGSVPTMVKKCENNEKCISENGLVFCGKVNSEKFVCVGEGEFPDVEDITFTYVCEAGKSKPVKKYKCNHGRVYPVDGLPCVHLAEGHDMAEIKCEEGKTGVFESSDKISLSYGYYCIKQDKYFTYRLDGNTVPFTEDPNKVEASM